MSHYFETPSTTGRTRKVAATIFGHELTFTTAPGVFSGTRLDPGTSVLLHEVDPPASGRVLDLGCGFGPIAVGLAVHCEHVLVDAVDVNDLAVELTNRNAADNGVGDRVRASRPEDVSPDAAWNEIWSNPPIRIGKDALHELLLTWLPRILPGGVAWLVVSKNLGADSLQRWLCDKGFECDRVASAKGFRVLRASRVSSREEERPEPLGQLPGSVAGSAGGRMPTGYHGR